MHLAKSTNQLCISPNQAIAIANWNGHDAGPFQIPSTQVIHSTLSFVLTKAFSCTFMRYICLYNYCAKWTKRKGLWASCFVTAKRISSLGAKWEYEGGYFSRSSKYQLYMPSPVKRFSWLCKHKYSTRKCLLFGWIINWEFSVQFKNQKFSSFSNKFLETLLIYNQAKVWRSLLKFIMNIKVLENGLILDTL